MALVWCLLFIWLTSPGWGAPTKHLVFFNHLVPSNLYVNAAHGITRVKQGRSQDDPEVIHLILYPAHEESKRTKFASAVLTSPSGMTGSAKFEQENPPVGSVHVTGVIEGLSPGIHRMHISGLGDITNGCEGLTEPYNPYHRPPKSKYRPVGDLGTVNADETGVARFDFYDDIVTLVGPRSVLGRALVISDLFQDSNAVVSCGVIGYG